MKKSNAVPASLIVAIASTYASAGCSCGSSYDCVDSTGKVIDSAGCRTGRVSGAHWIQRSGFGSSSSGGGFSGG